MNEQTDVERVSEHFPPDVRTALQQAARTPGQLAKLIAIDHVIATAKLRHPELFRVEDEPAPLSPGQAADLFQEA